MKAGLKVLIRSHLPERLLEKDKYRQRPIEGVKFNAGAEGKDSDRLQEM